MHKLQPIKYFEENEHTQSISQSTGWVEAAVKKHKDKLFRTALAIIGRKTDAEDIVQDAFVKLFEKQPEFESGEHEIAWLTRVTINLSKNHIRSNWWKKTIPLFDTGQMKNDEQYNVIESVRALSSKYRIVVHLFYYEGYSTKEIAEMTNQNESTVRNQLARARRMLKDILEGEKEILMR